MEINVLEESKNKLVVEIKGEGHTLCNALKSEIWKNKKGVAAGYNISHPLAGNPKLIIETESDDPKKLLVEAAKNIKKEADLFLKEFNKKVK